MNQGNASTVDVVTLERLAALGDILQHTEAVGFRWLAAPGWPVELVSDNVRNWGIDPEALQRGEPPFADLVHPDDLPRVAAEVTRHSTLGRNRFHQEYRLRKGADDWRWVEDHTWVERDENGQLVAFVGVLLDVTERKRAELALELAATAVPGLLATEPLETLILTVLQRLGQGLGADRVYIFETHPGETAEAVLASQRHEWCAPGIAPQIGNPALQNLKIQQYFPRWLGLLRAERSVSGAVTGFPPEERALLGPQQVRSLIVVPVNLRGCLWGFLGLDAVRSERVWSAADERVLRLTAAALGAAIDQRRSVEALRQSEERHRMALEGANAGAWEWSPERHSVWSDQHYRLLGLDPAVDTASFSRWMGMIHPQDRGRVETEVRAAYASARALAVEYRVVRENIPARWVATFGRPRFGATGEVEGMAGILLDIDARKQAEERLRLSAAVIDSTHDGVVVTDLEANIIAVNRAYCEITGYAEEQLLGQNPRLLQSGRHDADFYQQMWADLLDTGHWQGEIWSRRGSGEIYPEWLTVSVVRDELGHPQHYVGVVTDITRLKQTEADLAKLAHFDPLTGLPNRLLAQSRLEYAIERSEQDGRRLALLFIDMDRFKNVNDSLGHQVGDELLCAIGERFRRAAKLTDTVARLGGDEFLAIIENVGTARSAGAVAAGLLECLSEPFQLPSGHEVFANASIGISLFPEDGSTATDLVRCADAALYGAKDLGRNTFHFYTPSLIDAASDRLELEGRLRHALTRGEFVVYYQPLLDCQSGAMIGVEALVRWQPPNEPLVLPGRFIGLAEDTGLIGALGDWVMESACRQVQRWRRSSAPDLRLAVNLSARQLRQPEFPDRLTRVLADTGLDPDALELEVTESMLMEHGNMVLGTLHALRSLGVRVAIDDFGTGYSSLAYLKRLPLDTLKIDRSFVADIPAHAGGAEIASAIIGLAHTLHLDVLAEGVENIEQLNFLKAQGCDFFQGFLISEALSADDLASRFLNN